MKAAKLRFAGQPGAAVPTQAVPPRTAAPNGRPQGGTQNPGRKVYPNDTPKRVAIGELNSVLLRIT